MRTPLYIVIGVFSLIVIIIDYYSFVGLRKMRLRFNLHLTRIAKVVYWSIPVIIILSLFLLLFFRSRVNPKDGMVYFHYFSGVFLLFYIPKIIFLFFVVIDDLYHLVKYVFAKFNHRVENTNGGDKITRNTFLSRVGFLIAGIPFLSIIYGIGIGRFNLIIRKSNLYFPDLPKEFNGFKIIQISDLHLGSFNENTNYIADVVSLIDNQSPDLILFTGDFVNNVAEEISPFIPVLSKLQARFGMYSILGNHDYGEYVSWNSEKEKKENLATLIADEEKIGFKVLLNQSVKINKGESTIRLIGVENWGFPPFPQYGKLNKALENSEENEFKILMSHDPTHWRAEVVGQTNINLTLSGHTHGAQFGIEIPGWRWSPINLRYNEWGGIYKESKQIINVNTGLGFIGFPGRIGMPPEISVIVLRVS